MSLPTDSAERKHIPIYTGLLVYFPDALAGVARHSFENNEKHNPGEPCHWSREKSNDHMDCIARHLTDIAARPTDLDFKVSELKAVAWRALAELQLSIEKQQTADAAERAGIVQPVTYHGPFKPSVPGPRHAYTPSGAGATGAAYGPGASGYEYVQEREPKHRIGEMGACDCAECVTQSVRDPVYPWTPWPGLSPVPPIGDGILHQVKFRDGTISRTGARTASRWSWQHASDRCNSDIVAYRRL